MRKRWLGFGLALLIGISGITDLGMAAVSATEASNTTGAASAPSGNAAPAPSTADNARFTVDGAERVVTENLNPNKYPADFTETQVECKGRKYKGLKSNFSDIQMICLLNRSTGAAAYYIYREEDQSVYPFIKIENGKDYIIAMPESMSGDAQAPAGYVKAELEFEKGKAQVYRSEENPGVCLIYAMNNEGEKNWYVYNEEEKTYQAYQEEGGDESADQGEDEGEKVSEDEAASLQKYVEAEKELRETKAKYRMIIAVMTIIIAILLFFLINTLLRNSQGREADYEMDEEDENPHTFAPDVLDEEEEFFGAFEEESVKKTSVKNSKRKLSAKEISKEEPKERDFPENEAETERREMGEKKYESDIEILDLNDL